MTDKDLIQEYLRQIGAKGGAKAGGNGGRARWKGVSAKQRSAAMKKVRAAAKKRKPKKG